MLFAFITRWFSKLVLNSIFLGRGMLDYENQNPLMTITHKVRTDHSIICSKYSSSVCCTGLLSNGFINAPRFLSNKILYQIPIIIETLNGLFKHWFTNLLVTLFILGLFFCLCMFVYILYFTGYTGSQFQNVVTHFRFRAFQPIFLFLLF